MNQEEMFRVAIRENDRRVFNICRHYFGPGDEARDAYQEILLKIWLEYNQFPGRISDKDLDKQDCSKRMPDLSFKSKKKFLCFCTLFVPRKL